MAAVLGTNMASVWASKNLRTAQSDMANSVERLSSGLRINRAKDDAAGLAIANSLTQQINGANQGIKNLNDGISIVQTAEGAIAAASEMAQRILTLATQATNGTFSSAQRVSVGDEMQALWNSIGLIESRTKVSGNAVLNASADITIRASNVSSDTFTLSSTTALENIHTSAGTSGSIATAATTQVAYMDYAIKTAEGASPTGTMFSDVITAAAGYITYLDTQRAALGAVQNQMEYAVENISQLSANLTAARSQTIDTDYAAETAQLTKGQILQQAATAMLAQANQMPNVILSLLK
jgi:flagellin